MAAPTFVAVSQTITSGGAEPTQTTSIALPTGWQQNDILLLYFTSVNGARGCDTPVGWKSYQSQAIIGGSFGWLFWKRAGASETDPVILTRGETGQRMAVMFAIRGCPTIGDPWDVASIEGSGATGSWSMSVPTTVHNDCLIVHIACSGADNLTGGRVTSFANAGLTSVTEQLDSWSSAGGGIGTFVGTGVKATAGATGNSTATNSASESWGYVSLAMKSAADSDAVVYAGPTFVGVGSAAVTGVAATITPTLPSGTAENDILFLLIAEAGATISSFPSGYANITGSPDTNFYVMWKRAGASEGNPSITASTVTSILLAQVIGFRGCKTSGNPWSDISSFATDSTSNTDYEAPAVNTSQDHSFVVHFLKLVLDNISGGRLHDPANTGLRNLVECADLWNATGNGNGFAAFGGECITANGSMPAGHITVFNAAGQPRGVSLALPKDAGASAPFQGGAQVVWTM